MEDAIDVKTYKDSVMNFRVFEFMWRDMKLKGLELLVYAYIHQFPACFLTREDFVKCLGLNIKTLDKILEEMVTKRIILKWQVNINDVLKRNVYIAMIKQNGRYPYESAMQDVKKAEAHLQDWYSNKNIIRQKDKK